MLWINHVNKISSKNRRKNAIVVSFWMKILTVLLKDILKLETSHVIVSKMSMNVMHVTYYNDDYNLTILWSSHDASFIIVYYVLNQKTFYVRNFFSYWRREIMCKNTTEISETVSMSFDGCTQRTSKPAAISVCYEMIINVVWWDVSSQHQMKKLHGFEHPCHQRIIQ